MKNKSTEKQRPLHSKTRKLAGSALVATAIIAGAITHQNQNQTEKKLSTQEQDIDVLTQQLDSLQNNLEQQQQVIQEERAKTDYALSLAGVDTSEISEHMQYPTIEIPRSMNPEIAEKHKQATVHILTLPANSTAPETPLEYRCTGLKIDESTITSARHCFNEVYTDAEKGGSGPVQVTDNYVTSNRYFISSQPNLTLEEASTQAVEITSFGTDYMSGDSVLLGVDSTNEWFDSIDPLPMATQPPTKGDIVHVAGYPNGVTEPVTATGIVLGEVLSAETYGASYQASLTMVAVTPESTEDFTCSFGASGSGLSTEQGTSYGALAFVSRSFTPATSIDVTLEGEKLLKMESDLETRLAGQDYILCAYSPILPVEILPLAVDMGVVPVIEGK